MAGMSSAAATTQTNTKDTLALPELIFEDEKGNEFNVPVFVSNDGTTLYPDMVTVIKNAKERGASKSLLLQIVKSIRYMITINKLFHEIHEIYGKDIEEATKLPSPENLPPEEQVIHQLQQYLQNLKNPSCPPLSTSEKDNIVVVPEHQNIK